MKEKPVFDFIIVGAGSAGCVLANRLTTAPTTSVLLLEAGGPDNKQEIHVPVAFSKLFKSECDWAYYTEEQAHLKNRRLYWPRGKVLGGSSSMNAMIYTRGNPHDYDHWHRLGNQGWSFSEVLPLFRKAENRPQHASERHDPHRLLCVSDLRNSNPLSRAFVEACVEIGITRNDDFSSETREGAGFFQVTQKRGKRHSTAVAYLKPALKRRNLTVRTHAHVTRLLFEGQRAIGVEYVQDGKSNQARAEREVILCGGAVNSPQLLMLSGIGPADQLKGLGLRVIADLPGVGKNLQDHLLASVTYQCTQPVSLARAEGIGNLLRYLFFRKGMLASNVGEAGAFIKSRDDVPAPDLELIFGPVYYMSHSFSNPEGDGFSIGAILLHPQSKGSIRLRSNDPFDAPAIDPAYLSSGPDLQLLVEGVKICRRVAQAKAFDAFRGGEVWPGTDVQGDEELAGFIRNTVETLYHPVGTCKMGSDDLAVVDSQLKVHGVNALRVIDASIMPTIITGHPNAAVIMIAERGAELTGADSSKQEVPVHARAT